MVDMGLRTPGSRALCAGLLVASASYVLKRPRAAFRENGAVRADAPTGSHFLLMPVSAAVLAYLFT